MRNILNRLQCFRGCHILCGPLDDRFCTRGGCGYPYREPMTFMDVLLGRRGDA